MTQKLLGLYISLYNIILNKNSGIYFIHILNNSII